MQSAMTDSSKPMTSKQKIREMAKERELQRIETQANLTSASKEEGGKNDAGGNDSEDEFDIKGWFKEVTLYMIWLLSFTFAMFATRDSIQMFEFTQLWKNLATANIENVVSIPDWWSYVESDVVALLQQSTIDTDDFALSKLTESNNRFGNIQVGPIRIRQLRVKSVPCRALDGLVPQGAECFPDWDSDEEETTYSKSVALNLTTLDSSLVPAYSWKDNEETEEILYGGKFNWYPGSGYVVDLTNSTTAQPLLKDLQDRNWVDLKTRAVFVDFAFYNPNLDMFIVARILSEILASGTVATTPVFRSMILVRYNLETMGDFIIIGLEGIVVFFVLFYLAEESLEMFKQGFASYFGQFWNTLDILNLILFVVMIVLRVRTTFSISTMIEDIENVNSARLQSTAFLMTQEFNIAGVNGLIMWMKVFKYVKITTRLARLAKTLEHAMVDIATYGFIFAVVMTAYSIAGVMLFGNDLRDYVDFGTCLSTLIRQLFGEFDYPALLATNSILGPIYLFSWLIASGVVLLNMVVAIIGEVYAEITAEDQANPPRSMMDSLREAAARKMEKLMKKRGVVDALEKKLEDIDADDDGVIDEMELDQFLKMEGALEIFDAKDVATVMAKFDKDNTGKLDRDEMKQLRKHIETERKKLSRGLTWSSKLSDGSQSNQGSRPTSAMSTAGGFGGALAARKYSGVTVQPISENPEGRPAADGAGMVSMPPSMKKLPDQVDRVEMQLLRTTQTLSTMMDMMRKLVSMQQSYGNGPPGTAGGVRHEGELEAESPAQYPRPMYGAHRGSMGAASSMDIPGSHSQATEEANTTGGRPRVRQRFVGDEQDKTPRLASNNRTSRSNSNMGAAGAGNAARGRTPLSKAGGGTEKHPVDDDY